jgi:hypothetical protein
MYPIGVCIIARRFITTGVSAASGLAGESISAAGLGVGADFIATLLVNAALCMRSSNVVVFTNEDVDLVIALPDLRTREAPPAEIAIVISTNPNRKK